MADETSEMIRVVSRMIGVTISLIIIFAVFNAILGIDRDTFITYFARDAVIAAASR